MDSRYFAICDRLLLVYLTELENRFCHGLYPPSEICRFGWRLGCQVIWKRKKAYLIKYFRLKFRKVKPAFMLLVF